MKSFLDYLDEMKAKTILEMAEFGDVSKAPVKFDEEDRDFLEQFPSYLWTQAKHKRYEEDFVPALEQLEQARKKVVGEMFDKYYKHALKEKHINGNKQLAKTRAQELAEKYAEKTIPSVQYPEERPYHFITTGGREITIVAKPYINRLIHKLGTTRGETHHAESGLDKVYLKDNYGKYGYDLWDIQQGNDKVRPFTRGWQGASKEQIGERMSDWMNHNAHQMFGNLPNQGEQSHRNLPVNWEEVKGWQDNYTTDKVRKELIKKYMKETGNEIAARSLAEQELIQMAEKGMLRGPPNPLHPTGRPVEVGQDLQGNKFIKKLPMYLPHHEMPVKYLRNGKVETYNEKMPVLNPAKYLKKYNQEDEGQPTLGHENDWVESPHYQQGHPEHMAGAALHFNRNSTGRYYLDPSNPEYQKRFNFLHQEMPKAGLGDNNRPTHGEDYYRDLLDGLWDGLDHYQGGATGYEVDILQSLVPELHEVAYRKLLENLRDERMFKRSGRRNLATNVIRQYAQQDLGGGSRRLRKDNPELPNLDKVKDQIKGCSTEVYGCKPHKLGQGEHQRQTGICAFPYDVRKLKAVMDEAGKEAKSVDAKVPNSLQSAVSKLNKKSEVLMKITLALKSQYINQGSSDAEAEQKITADLALLRQGNPSAEALVSKFRKKFDQVEVIGGIGREEEKPANEPVKEKKSYMQELLDNKQWGDLANYRGFLSAANLKWLTYVAKKLKEKIDSGKMKGSDTLGLEKLTQEIEKRHNK